MTYTSKKKNQISDHERSRLLLLSEALFKTRLLLLNAASLDNPTIYYSKHDYLIKAFIISEPYLFYILCHQLYAEIRGHIVLRSIKEEIEYSDDELNIQYEYYIKQLYNALASADQQTIYNFILSQADINLSLYELKTNLDGIEKSYNGFIKIISQNQHLLKYLLAFSSPAAFAYSPKNVIDNIKCHIHQYNQSAFFAQHETETTSAPSDCSSPVCQYSIKSKPALRAG